MLRNVADRRTLLFIATAVSLGVLQWNLPRVNPFLYVLSLFMAVTIAVISHNHNHLGLFRSRPLNLLTSYVLALHYGHPTVAWVPTHNQNHHKFNNAEGDLSRSPVVFRRNHLLALLVYPTITSMRQMRGVRQHFKAQWSKDRRSFWLGLSEYVVFFGVMLTLLVLDWRKALLFYVVPQQFALFVIQVFSYVQHIDCEQGSEWNHSRNFVSPVLNALLFNNGYHTVHHLSPGVHWSAAPALHQQHAAKIHPDLLQRSWWGFMTSVFILGHSARPRMEQTPAVAA